MALSITKNNQELCNSDGQPVRSSKYESSYVWLSKDRIIFLKENITKELAADMTALLLYYDSNSTSEPVNIYIHCNGGDADGLIQIYDVMQMMQSPIRTICIGKAYSAGAVLLAAGTKGMRCAFKNSRMMIHGLQGYFPIPGQDHANSNNYMKFMRSNNDNIMKILSKHTGIPLKDIKEDCSRDLFLTPSQAVKYGLIDKVV